MYGSHARISHFTERGISLPSVISAFRPVVDEICALLGCYAAYSDNSLPTFRDNLSGRILKVPIDCPAVYPSHTQCNPRRTMAVSRIRKNEKSDYYLIYVRPSV